MATYTRNELKQYALRSLGHPVIEINVSDEQLDDRIDEALEYWKLYHYEGIERMYLKHRINASKITLSENIASTFPITNTITGQTSGSTAIVTRQVNEESHDNILLVKNVTGNFSIGETITDGVISATFQSIVLGEVDTKYLELPDHIYGVVRILPFSGASSSKNIFDIQYQLRLHDLYDLTSTSIVYYKMVMNHLALLDFELNAKPSFEFNRMNGKVYTNFRETDIALGDFLILECYRALDPEQNKKVYNEPWLKHYVTALFKKQWASALKKFGGLQLPGGVIIDGQALYDEAIQEIRELEDELLVKSAPLSFFIG